MQAVGTEQGVGHRYRPGLFPHIQSHRLVKITSIVAGATRFQQWQVLLYFSGLPTQPGHLSGKVAGVLARPTGKFQYPVTVCKGLLQHLEDWCLVILAGLGKRQAIHGEIYFAEGGSSRVKTSSLAVDSPLL